MRKIKKLSISVACLAISFFIGSETAYAVCAGSMFNPVKDICWQCMFPMKIGGQTVYDSPGMKDPPSDADATLCVCPTSEWPYYRVGVPFSFWDPSKLIETVKDDYCFPAAGYGKQQASVGPGSGGSDDQVSGGENNTIAFQQAHYIKYPVWKVVQMFEDVACQMYRGELEIPYITEPDPLWVDEALVVATFNMDALLFANSATVLMCMADAVAANIYLPIPALYWCMGSWGSAHPLAGFVNLEDYTEANAAIASKFLNKLLREGVLCDNGAWTCACVPTVPWIKWNYRYQLAKPVRDWTCRVIGESALKWGAGKNPKLAPGKDNFLTIMWNKSTCCVSE